MRIRKADLRTVCGYTSALPEMDLPEIVFAGRSNVGKSSLINALVNRKKLARVGETPGKTRTINFYEVEADLGEEEHSHEGGNLPAPVRASFLLVDLPGYGYASVSRTEKEKWGKLVERYFRSRQSLARIFLLVDIRHVPGANDQQMYRYIKEKGLEVVVIATKADKIKRSQLGPSVKKIQEALSGEEDLSIIPFSALKRDGTEKILSLIGETLTGEVE